ncbi:beta-1,3-galactosyltransferase 1-like [Anneissia japonica]|uniref:beta-1,3-galactosyltransferase 1-like n=1 Tax=Anneissia japonica TaxID=1529436 RepID=UPI0014256619|nr:beta-1,3-galactosyltransferase 1-like [Anneissia japonica]
MHHLTVKIMQLYRNLLILVTLAFVNFLFYIHVFSYIATEKAEIEQLKKLLELKYRDLHKEPAPRDESSEGDVQESVAEPVEEVRQMKLIDPRKDFRFTLNNEYACFNLDGTYRRVFLLVVVFSIHEHFEQRKLIRRSWGSVEIVNDRNIVTKFLLGRVHNSGLQTLVEEENDQYDDIIIGDFDDTYKNLTLKTIQTLKWVTNYCSHAKYVMKTDDDMFVHYKNIVNFLAGNTSRRDYAVGYYMKTKPIRNVRSKWYMPKDVYPHDKYPPFLSGTGYIMSVDLVMRMNSVSSDVAFLHLEDVFAGTLWQKLGVKPQGNKRFHNAPVKFSYCAYKKLFTSHTSPNFVRVWRELKTTENKKC